ncbi:MAG TPA: pyridoxal-phosphate dependent enzyme [Actinomycetales bacterium]|nr:pyridoxal-phosphate dependent enzyme [Actinomycetales bacterium]
MVAWYSSRAARDWVGPEMATGAEAFHRSLPAYAPTPLVPVPELATGLGVGQVLVKDESSRLGLPAFKVLGASWASSKVLEQRPGAMLVTATDGNHGRAVARMASHFGVSSTVFVPAVMLPETAALIEGEGATVLWVNGDYDEAVRRAAEFAEAEPDHRALVQDTAWDGYEQVPAWIVEGYQTLLAEVDAELGRAPDLVAIPVGVGSLAEAVVRHYRRPDMDAGARTSILSVEPDTAACLVTSLSCNRPVTVQTGATVMAGLNCGTVSSAAWPVLQAGCDAAVAVTDAGALQAVHDLARLGVSSGPSGAATLAGVRAVLGDQQRRAELDLETDAVVVLLSTEGTQR